MINPIVTREFENQILELIDTQEDYTRGDLQGMVTVLVNKIMERGHEILQTQEK
ncbi:MAG: hypothetical protein ABI758_00640 [Candidatus Woesebacteria bacterium]